MVTATKRGLMIVDGKRFYKSQMIDLDISTREEHGNRIVGVYMTPKRHVVVVEGYSIWERDHSGECVGTTYHIADAQEIASLADEYGRKELTDLVPEFVDASLLSEYGNRSH